MIWNLFLFAQIEKKISPSSVEHSSEEGRRRKDENKTYSADDVSYVHCRLTKILDNLVTNVLGLDNNLWMFLNQNYCLKLWSLMKKSTRECCDAAWWRWWRTDVNHSTELTDGWQLPTWNAGSAGDVSRVGHCCRDFPPGPRVRSMSGARCATGKNQCKQLSSDDIIDQSLK